MTASPSPGAPYAVHSIDHFALNVPSLAQAQHFFTTFGLDVRDAIAPERGLDLYATDGHRWARLLPAAGKSLAYLQFHCFAEDFDALRAQVAQAGATPTDRPSSLAAATGRVRDDGFWFLDPDGCLIGVRVGEKTSPDAKPSFVLNSSANGARGTHCRHDVAQVRPRRLSHVLLFTPDVLRALAFYRDALGLRLSDRSQDLIAFTHAPHGCDHHLVAFAKSHARGWHHCSWDVASLDEVGNGAAQMAAAGYRHGWGTGRHVLGSNYFHYVQDPWGSFSEYSADIDYVGKGQTWPAGDFDPEDSLYLWGPDVPEDFIRNTDTPDTPDTAAA
ncbi:metapyrocatechase [Pandoraea fibrosis]|uniref:Metapyrocatechase n=1 Tax=Pandoraea fibrosis TaxID=1891094 RepID=A0ABX6HSK6_9BURK|nr:VOC family protein [Pandoraea fibrosis]QHE92553.1 metapyrocatechase [Pandoraea fibrosis]QHF13891.1 metapyrocatechase [Pandoraea fibrosis]